MLEKIKRKILNIHGKAAAWFGLHPAVMAIVLALSIAFANELLSRRSFIQAVVFMFTRPLVFLCNAVIILVFEAIGLVFKKRSYMMALFSLLFLILGITNFIVRCFRQTPFSSMDFTLVKSVFPILSVYLSVAGLIAAAAGIIAVVIFLIIRWKKAKKIPVRKKYAAVTLASSLMAAGLLIGSGYLFRVFPEHFSNLSDAYRDYGFTYCFAAGIIDRGSDKPDDYDDKIKDVVSDILSTDETNESDSPAGLTDRVNRQAMSLTNRRKNTRISYLFSLNPFMISSSSPVSAFRRIPCRSFGAQKQLPSRNTDGSVYRGGNGKYRV